MSLEATRRAIRPLLDQTAAGDATAVYYAYHHPENRVEIKPYPAGAERALGYVALAPSLFAGGATADTIPDAEALRDAQDEEAVVRPDQFAANQELLQLSVTGQRYWDDAWSKFKAG